MQLNAEQKLIGRRNFLKAAAVVPAAGAIALSSSGIGPVKAGIVGTGMEGRILIASADPKYLQIVAMCDIRPDNTALGKTLIGSAGHHSDPKQYEKYEDMLNDDQLEAIVIATPLHLHGSMAIQALKAGKNVFVEKTMAYSIDECNEMNRIARQSGLNLQVGHQRFYNPLYWSAYRMLQEGLLGNVYHARALWHRNTDWNYWTHAQRETANMPKLMHELMNMKPEKYGYKDLQHMVNWRWYREYSHGLWTELCSHQIAITNWFFNSMPTAVYASGGNFKSTQDQKNLYESLKAEFQLKKHYNDTPAQNFDEYRLMKMGYSEDDRTISDHIYAIFEYPGNRSVVYTSVQSSSVDQYYEQIMGTRGTIVLSNENETYLFWEPGWDENTSRQAALQEKSTQVEVVQEDLSGSAFEGHQSSEATGSGGASNMTPYEPYKWELQGFAHTIRTGAPNLCDGKRGAMAAIPCLMGQESLRQQKRLEIPQLTVA